MLMRVAKYMGAYSRAIYCDICETWRNYDPQEHIIYCVKGGRNVL